jgi:Mg2+-importing ATPase
VTVKKVSPAKLLRGGQKVGSRPKHQVLDFDYVGLPAEVVLEKLASSRQGLSEDEAEDRLFDYGYNEPARRKRRAVLFQLLSRFANPLMVVLLIIAAVSFFLGERISAFIVSLMAVISVLLSFIQEYRAGKAAEKLNEMVHVTSTVYRDGRVMEVKLKEIVPGDVVELFAGDMIPADIRIISCKDLFINQASLTGESFPVEKVSSPIQSKSTSPSDLTNIAFMGSSVVNGTGMGVVLKTGVYTQFGELSKRLASMSEETSFERGIRGFTMLMIKAIFFMVLAIFAVNAILKGNIVEAFLFSLAVAVGLTPEMLPMLVAVNLSKGAMDMADKKVIVKRLKSIQNLGAMDILCTDKTGTLTLNSIVLEKHCNLRGDNDEEVLRYAYINSFYHTGLKNLLDATILKHEHLAVKEYTKIDEIPFDFSRRIMSVIVKMDSKHFIISKGAPEDILARCTMYELDRKIIAMDERMLAVVKAESDRFMAEGFRVLAVAYRKDEGGKEVYSADDEKSLVLKGYLAFLDPPKPSVGKTIIALKNLGIELKVLTGDSEIVTEKICSEVGLDVKGLLTGDALEGMSDAELQKVVDKTTVFARLAPIQKERVIRALKKNKHVVGYLGDGINDAPSLMASDIGISVDNAVDIAKESADIILLKKSLLVLADGVIEGRKTFMNVVKYIKMGSSSNFGNMLSMTGASLFIPFLPMLPIQILLNNFLYDMSQIAIPSDRVDSEYVMKPRPWNISFIKRFMLVFGPVSSIFDFMTFGVMLFIFKAPESLFQTGWFVESLCTQTLVIYVIRTEKIPFLESRPSRFLLATSLLIVAVGIILPFSPIAGYFGFVSLPPLYFVALMLMVVAYLILVQLVKVWFIKRYGYD